MERIESIILRTLIADVNYMRRVLPFLEPSYFLDKTEREIFQKIKAFIDHFNVLPTTETLIIDYSNTPGIGQDDIDECTEYLTAIQSEVVEQPHLDWMIEKTEQWCQEKAIHNAVMQVINILDGKDKEIPKGMIPKLLQNALAISFDPHVGHDYVEDSDKRFDFYHKVDSKIPFYLDYFNRVTKGGVSPKTLNVVMAGTGTGKSLFMCDLAGAYLMQGKQVLYITLEMAEERIAERIDANLMNRPVDDLNFMSRDAYQRQMARINEKTKGRLIIKEYATGSAHVGHFRHLLNELLLKKQFKPDVIFIDYLNICASSRLKASSGLYELVKSIAEELRGLGVEFSVPIWSATQLNRTGFANSDPDLTHTSESFGLPQTCDLLFALVVSDEMQSLNQIMVKMLKNRYGDLDLINKETGKSMRKFVIGIDRSKQKLFNLEESAQMGLNDDIDDVKNNNKAGKSSCQPVFECDQEPTTEFKGAVDEAERRRSATKPEIADLYKRNLVKQKEKHKLVT